MKKRIVWLLVSCLMVAALVLASCGPAETGEEEEVAPPGEEEVAPPGEEEVVPPKEEKVTEETEAKPEYGGELIIGWSRDAMHFDDAQCHPYWAPTFCVTNEELSQGDWIKGPAGTGEAEWIHQIFPPLPITTSSLAESWEVTDPQTLVFHIRKGVRWHNKPPTNGRELTADDVLFTLDRIWDSLLSHPGGSIPREQYIESITSPDKWTVVIKTREPGQVGDVFEGAARYTGIVPRDAAEQYGGLDDWRNTIGTGPFILTDYISGSSATFVRNPNYWMEDPLNPGNRLPYVDGMKWLIIPDPSTRLSALRTAKVDTLTGGYSGNIGWEDAESLKKTSPELEYIGGLAPSPTGLFMRLDNPELPWYDKRVRRALAMAIDNKAIGESLYGGKYRLVAWPVAPVREHMEIYTPFEELPESSQELFEYHPDKAKELLAEAGYPDGFSCEIVAMTSYVDILAVVKDYWSKVGVDLKIDVREYGAWANLRVQRKHKEMLVCALNAAIPYYLSELAAGKLYNCSIVDDPKINQAREDMFASYFDPEKKAEIMMELNTYVIDQVYVVQMPAGYAYNFWWPWLKNYHGEIQVGCYGQYANWVKYVWLDQALKEEMTGKR